MTVRSNLHRTRTSTARNGLRHRRSALAGSLAKLASGTVPFGDGRFHPVGHKLGTVGEVPANQARRYLDTRDYAKAMANPEHLAKLKDGVEPWNQWREQNPEIRADLSGANLGMANLCETNLSNANLLGANLDGANLTGADLSKAILSRANLLGANLLGVNLTDAHLIDAHLRAANLFGANLLGADLRVADLREANLDEANLSEANLDGANLSWASVSGANLIHANLDSADLRRAYLSGADLSKAILSGANLRGANLRGANLRNAHFREADLSGANLTEALLVNTDLEAANLTGCCVYGISAWNVRLEGAIRSNLLITPPNESPIQVDNLKVAQFIYLLLSRQKLRDVITTLGEKAVLILGRFTERKELLDRMADKLRLLGYIPMIFDFDRPTDRDLTETVKILAGLSRFVIADITNPRSVPLELQATVPDYMVPFVTILQRGQPAFGMFDDLPRKYNWALPLLEYNSAEPLLAAFEQKVIGPALDKADEVRREKAVPSFSTSVNFCSLWPPQDA